MAIHGTIDASADERHVSGWARDDSGAHPLTVEARLDGVVVAHAKTDIDRPDLGGRVGFGLRFAAPVALDTASSGRLTIGARTGDGPATPLAWHATLLDLLATRDAGQRLAPLPLDRMIEAIILAAQRVAADPSRSSTDQRAFSRLERLVQLVRQPDDDRAFAEPLTYVATAPGTTSLDGSALIGHNGHIYLCGGTNRLAEQFEMSPDDPRVGLRADGWAATFRGRAAALRERGIRYVQTIIPDKVSVVPDHWPGAITTPSPTLRAIEERLCGAGDDFYFSAHRALHEDAHRIETFRKIDTHLTWYGTRLLFERFCRSAGLDAPFMGEVDLRYPVVIGDFTDRFPGLPLLERIAVPDSHALADAASGLVETEARIPDPQHHIGAYVKWHNPKAPIDRKVLVFGNSFFEYRLWPLTLSWWFARAFRDYEFFWDPDVDMAVVDASRPDIVIGQTIERFLPKVPDR